MTQGRKGFVVTVMLFLCLVLPGIILAGDRDADKNNKVSRQSMEGGSFNPRKGGDSMMDTQAINHPEQNISPRGEKSENSGNAAVSADTWTIERPDRSKGFTNMSPRSIAIDSLNAPHIVYGGKQLYYAQYDGSQWHYETVDATIVRYVSLALDSSGKVHI